MSKQCHSKPLCHNADTYARSVLKWLQHLRRSQEFCDIDIRVGIQLFKGHKNVLSSASPYFRAMFAGGMLEEAKDEVEIQGVIPEIFQQLLEFMYSGEIEVNTDNCQELLAAADMFQLSDVLEACCEFLTQQLHPSNCLGIYRFAEAHACLNLQNTCENYINNNFLDVISNEEYFDISKDLLIQLLQSENLHIENEMQVFHAAMDWMKYDVQKRRRFVFEVLGPIRFPIISQKQIEKSIEDCDDLSLKIALRKLVQDFHRDKKMPFELKIGRVKPYLLQPRKCARKSIYVIGGYRREKGGRWSDSQSLTTVECFDSFNQRWKTLANLRHARSGHGIACLNSMIYVIGGESDSLIFDNAECLDPSTNKWSMIPSMTVPRCGLGVCVANDCIYAFGGWVGSEIGDTVEKYDPVLNHWTQVNKVNTLRFAMGVVEHQGLIYVIGGMSDLGTEMKTVESYNPITKEWVELPPLKMERAYVGLAVLDNCLYAVGGWNEMRGALKTVEKYLIDKDVWVEIPSMSMARAGAAVGAFNGLLYVIGGRTSCDEYTAPSTLDSVECYDPQTDSWLDIGDMPTSRCEAGIAIL